jgi:hypothetical protein
MKKLALISVMALTAAGCASPTPQIVQTYVPIGTYGNYSCPMLSDEMMRINRRFTELAGVQDVNAREDTIKAGVAVAGLTTAGLGGAALAGASEQQQQHTDYMALLTALRFPLQQQHLV